MNAHSKEGRASARDTSIAVRGLRASYGRKEVLRGLDLDVAAGTTTVLLGANGTGKSTLLRACLGELRASAARLQVAGLDPRRQRSRVLRRVGFVPDKPDVYPWMRPVDLFGLLRAHLPTWSDARARELVARLDVPAKTPFRALSRGQGMKAMLAAALAHDPDVLLLDEPFGGIDVVARRDILRGVIQVLDGQRRTVLVTTHDLDVAARLADRVAVLADGRIEREGAIDTFTNDGGTREALEQALVLAQHEETVR